VPTTATTRDLRSSDEDVKFAGCSVGTYKLRDRGSRSPADAAESGSGNTTTLEGSHANPVVCREKRIDERSEMFVRTKSFVPTNKSEPGLLVVPKNKPCGTASITLGKREKKKHE